MSSDPVKKGQKFQNREAFKAHRNIKRAVSDVTKETTLKNKACIGVCRRCVQKVRERPRRPKPLETHQHRSRDRNSWTATPLYR
jgi:hypothetical protein